MYATIIALKYGICYVPKILSVQLFLKESFSEKGVRYWKRYKEVLKNIMELLKTSEMTNVFPKFKESYALASLQMPMLKFLLINKKYWDCLSPNLIKLILWREFKKEIRRSPAFITKFINCLRGSCRGC